MQINILSLFKPLLDSFLATGILKRAIDKELLKIKVIDYRDYGIGKHKRVDGRPFGGGVGMLLRPEPIVNALESISPAERGVVFLLSPQGEVFEQQKAIELSKIPNFSLICGRYEGFDHRVRKFVDRQISLGSFILMGGEVAAMAIVESVARYIPGVLGNSESVVDESFSDNTLEYPQYTKPVNFRDLIVPDILRSGHHAKIIRWQEMHKSVLKEDK
ncbi:MAG: tRNA (guanosine(37)-N1)-methyltransferase TrmD [SAR324 cluster bacterium]|nr:tRNA (guanosine(37)-N1)-methyltransferase TrmD [SAR324 cluster bacterium]